MYANSPEAAELRRSKTYSAIQKNVGGCREWVDEKNDRCWAPAEYILWGKLFDPDALGPRCYDHAAAHAGHHALGDRAWAIIDVAALARDIDAAHFPFGHGDDE
jgi:hypothetical protein